MLDYIYTFFFFAISSQFLFLFIFSLVWFFSLLASEPSSAPWAKSCFLFICCSVIDCFSRSSTWTRKQRWAWGARLKQKLTIGLVFCTSHPFQNRKVFFFAKSFWKKESVLAAGMAWAFVPSFIVRSRIRYHPICISIKKMQMFRFDVVASQRTRKTKLITAQKWEIRPNHLAWHAIISFE